jgi:hypothetical protein
LETSPPVRRVNPRLVAGHRFRLGRSLGAGDRFGDESLAGVALSSDFGRAEGGAHRRPQTAPKASSGHLGSVAASHQERERGDRAAHGRSVGKGQPIDVVVVLSLLVGLDSAGVHAKSSGSSPAEE